MRTLIGFLHVLGAAIWVGGLLFLAYAVVPAARPLAPAERGALLIRLGRRFRWVGWSALGLTVLSGLWFAAGRGLTPDAVVSGAFFTPAGWLLVAKGLAVGLMLVVTALHDFRYGPASAAALAQGDSARQAALRRRSVWLARLSALLALVVVALGSLLTRSL